MSGHTPAQKRALRPFRQHLELMKQLVSAKDDIALKLPRRAGLRADRLRLVGIWAARVIMPMCDAEFSRCARRKASAS